MDMASTGKRFTDVHPLVHGDVPADSMVLSSLKSITLFGVGVAQLSSLSSRSLGKSKFQHASSISSIVT